MATLTDDDLKLLLESVDALVGDFIAPRASEIDRTAQFPRDVYGAMAQMGLFGLWVPEEYDGLGWNLKVSLLIAERIARVSGTCALMFTNCGDATFPVWPDLAITCPRFTLSPRFTISSLAWA